MARLDIEVVYATAARQDIVAVDLPEGGCVMDAVRASGLVPSHPGITGEDFRLGIFGREVDPGTLLKPGDRVEIYRPLRLDPKAARREKARAKRRAVR